MIYFIKNKNLLRSLSEIHLQLLQPNHMQSWTKFPEKFTLHSFAMSFVLLSTIKGIEQH